MSSPAVLATRLGIAALLLVGAGAVVQLGARELAPTPDPSPTPPEPADDTGEVIDFAHLRDKDLDFLEEVLREGSPEGRRSAARALVVAEDPRGARLMLDVAADAPDPDEGLLLCLAALDVLRLQTLEETQRAILQALERADTLPEGCVLELRDRFAVISRGAFDLEPLARAPEASARRFAARTLDERGGEDDEALLIELTEDPDPSVRRTAWLVWQGRERGPHRETLQALLAAEQDPQIAALARATLEEP
ncbi:MAG: hypothetical protein H6741_11570 [Alphaproteobacteria bacterium]|nr:hypothetical protein [Alphaproteobacteria bacterium]